MNLAYENAALGEGDPAGEQRDRRPKTKSRLTISTECGPGEKRG